MVALLTAAQDERIRGVCTWSTPAEFKGLESTARNIFGKEKIEGLMLIPYVDLPSGDRIGRSFFIDALKHDVSQAVTEISPRPILIVHGTNDMVVPVFHAEKLFEQAKGPKEKLLIQDADHTFNRWDWQWEAINRTAKWFEENLKT